MTEETWCAVEPYFVAHMQAALKLSRVGSLIMVDNVVREGSVLSPRQDEAAGAGDLDPKGRARKPKIADYAGRRSARICCDDPGHAVRKPGRTL